MASRGNDTMCRGRRPGVRVTGLEDLCLKRPSVLLSILQAYTAFFLAYCIKTDWWQKWEAWWQQLPLKTVKVEEKVCFRKKGREKPETEL